MVKSSLSTPWKISNEIRRYLALPVVWAYFKLHGVRWGKGWRVYGLPLIQRHSGSRIMIGNYMQMRNWFSSNPLGVNHRSILATWSEGAQILFGDDVNLTGTTICAQEQVTIGNHIRIGANSTIIDTDFHPLDASVRRQLPRQGRSEPVVIEDDVFIGMHVLILKGTRIGQSSVVGAGSVVAGEFPAGVLIAGNPARVVRHLEE